MKKKDWVKRLQEDKNYLTKILSRREIAIGYNQRARLHNEIESRSIYPETENEHLARVIRELKHVMMDGVRESE
jgi:hypothetical protein